MSAKTSSYPSLAENSLSTELTPESDHQSPIPEVMEQVNGGDEVATTPTKSMDEDHLLDGEQHVSMEHEAELLDPLHDWGQPQAMPAPSGALGLSNPFQLAVGNTFYVRFYN